MRILYEDVKKAATYFKAHHGKIKVDGLPVLHMIRIERDAMQISFKMTDLDTVLEYSVPCGQSTLEFIDGSEVRLVSLDRLLGMCKAVGKASADDVVITPDSDSDISVKCGVVSFFDANVPPDDFPAVWRVGKISSSLPSSATLQSHAKLVNNFQVAEGYMPGASHFIGIESDVLTVAGTDGHRATRITTPCIGDDFQATLTPDLIKWLASWDEKADVELRVYGNPEEMRHVELEAHHKNSTYKMTKRFDKMKRFPNLNKILESVTGSVANTVILDLERVNGNFEPIARVHKGLKEFTDGIMLSVDVERGRLEFAVDTIKTEVPKFSTFTPFENTTFTESGRLAKYDAKYITEVMGLFKGNANVKVTFSDKPSEKATMFSAALGRNVMTHVLMPKDIK